ncbi:MAG: hypothetical protein LR008_02465 [Candidatus Pacebacteria bacterium]|nr:hypothetical protein [Candidatus Paceibacterota bacterium]
MSNRKDSCDVRVWEIDPEHAPNVKISHADNLRDDIGAGVCFVPTPTLGFIVYGEDSKTESKLVKYFQEHAPGLVSRLFKMGPAGPII